METRASHVLIGAFSLGILLLAVLFVLWIGKSSFDREWDVYDVVFTEAVTGLSVGGAVQFNGIQVGEVRRLSLDPEDPNRVHARIRVSGGTPVKTDTGARLAITGLTGVAAIQLFGGSADAPPLADPGASDIPQIVAEASALQKLMSSGEDIAVSVNDLLLRLSVLLQQENLDRVAAVLENLETVSASVAGQSDGIGQALADITAASRGLRETMQHTEALVERLDSIAARTDGLLEGELQQAIVATREALDSVRQLADGASDVLAENREAIDNFGDQGLAQIGPTVSELRGTLRQMQLLIDRLREDPSGFLLGRDQPEEYEP